MKVFLYTTLGCHLCEQALDLLTVLQSDGRSLEIETVEIADSDSLMEIYGIRIPVIKKEDDQEIGWPFTLEELSQFLS